MQNRYVRGSVNLLRQLFPCLLLVSLSLPILVLAQEMEEDPHEKEWQEISLRLPLAPKSENLVVFYGNSSQSFSLDVTSLSIATDGTIRYTLVSTSNSGAKNISYEGLRCNTGEKKLYAFGRTDGTWSRSQRKQWDAISSNDFNKQHITLANEYFCEGKAVSGKAETIVGRIIRKQPFSPYLNRIN